MTEVLFSKFPGIITGAPFIASSNISSPGIVNSFVELLVSEIKIFPALSIRYTSSILLKIFSAFITLRNCLGLE